MIDYTLEHKNSFILSAYGFPIQASLQDYHSLALEREVFETSLQKNGRLAKLKKALKTSVSGLFIRITSENLGIILQWKAERD